VSIFEHVTNCCLIAWYYIGTLLPVDSSTETSTWSWSDNISISSNSLLGNDLLSDVSSSCIVWWYRAYLTTSKSTATVSVSFTQTRPFNPIIFTARCYAWRSVGYRKISVCPVRMSRSDIVSKRLHLSS